MRPRTRYQIELPRGHTGLEQAGVPLSGYFSAFSPAQALSGYLKRHGARPLYEELLPYMGVPGSGLEIAPVRQHATGRMTSREMAAPARTVQRALERAGLAPPEEPRKPSQVQMELFSTDF